MSNPKTGLRMSRKVFAALIAMFLILTGCSEKESPRMGELSSSESAKFSSISDPVRSVHDHFSIIMPKSWDELVMENNIVLYLPPGSSEEDPFSEKIALMLDFLPENITVSLREMTENDIEESVKASPSLEFSGNYYSALLGQIDGLEIEFTNLLDGQYLESKQIRALEGNVFYAFTHQCVKGKCKHSSIFREMASSFEWKKPE